MESLCAQRKDLKDIVIVVSVTAEKIILVGCDEEFFVLANAPAPEAPEQPALSTVTSTCAIVLQLNEL